MAIANQKGLVTVIIWAHYLLNLTVVVKHVQNIDVRFGEASASVIINWVPNANLLNLSDPEICLLDSDMEIVLKTEPDDFRIGIIEACERHPLQNIGTTYLQRYFNTRNTVPKDSPAYSDAAHLVVANAVLTSRRMFRPTALKREGKPLNYFNLDRWRIIAVSRMIFDDIDFDEETVNSYIEKARNRAEYRLYISSAPWALRDLEEKSYGESAQKLRTDDL